MKKKTLKIVSIVSIIIISLILLGITYGYYLTRIDGNKNAKSVEVVTGESKVVFTDISQPDTSDPIGPGFKTVKVFTVQNIGDLSATYSIYLVDVVNNFNRKQDITYNLYKKQGNITDVTINTDLSSWTSVNKEANLEFPSEMTVIAANEEIETPEVIYTYVLKVEYINHRTENQNEDQGKTLAFKVNLRSEDKITNPFSEGTLAANILENTTNHKNRTAFVSESLEKVAAEISGKAEIPLKTPVFAQERIINVEEENPASIYYHKFCNNGAGVAHNATAYLAWFKGETPEEAKTNSDNNDDDYRVKSYEEAVGHYIHSRCNGGAAYVESYDSTTKMIKFYSGYKTTTSNILSIENDEYGMSYYYRGNPIDNYVNYAGMCWRIVRIAGDGSIKLILEDQNTTCDNASFTGNWSIPLSTGSSTIKGNFGYREYAPGEFVDTEGNKNASTIYVKNYFHGETNGDTTVAIALKNFQSTFDENELKNLKSGDWCMLLDGYYREGESNNYTYKPLTENETLYRKASGLSYYYEAFRRLSNPNGNNYEPTLKCGGTKINTWDDENKTPMYVGMITADELAYAGGKYGTVNSSIYLVNDYFKSFENFTPFWSMTSRYYGTDGTTDYVFTMDNFGQFTANSVQGNSLFRPAISLKSGVKFKSGEGTQQKPYEIG